MRAIFSILFLSHALGVGSERIQVYFSPRGGCTAAITNALGQARSNVLVMAYSFTSTNTARSLVEAHRRGVKVSVILEDSQQTGKYSSATFLNNAGIETLIDSRHAIQHNKFMVIDRAVVITGSFNFTKAAEESNAENLLVIKNAVVATQYGSNWTVHAKHASLYERAGQKRR